MPCYDPRDSEYEAAQRRETAWLKAALCAIMTQLEKNEPSSNSLEQFYNDINWKEAGVSRKWLAKWWAEHMRQDAERREHEAKVAEKAQRVKHLKEKLNLTDEEWKILREDMLKP